jgi:ketosteroid isomerase-like protein
MIITKITTRIYSNGLKALERGDIDRLLGQFSEDCTMTFVGDTPLGADRLTGPDLRRWFERFGRLLPSPRFEIQRVLVSGPPWRQRLASHVLIHAEINGEPYTNQFAHFLTIRWGKVIEDLVLEDTQMWERACIRLIASGVSEASDGPLRPRGSVA